MKSWIRGIKEKFKKLPMQKKMMYSFAIPAVTCCVLVSISCFPFFFNSYQRQLEYSVNQSCVQAQNSLTNHVESMYYISELLIGNAGLQEILNAKSFGKEERLDNQYREYVKLNEIFTDIEQSNINFRIGIYLPDQLAYTNNEYFFYPESSLKKREDYEQLHHMISQGKIYFGISQERTLTNTSLTQDYISLFRQSQNVTDSGELRTFVYKVEIPLSSIRQVLQNASATQNTLVYLLGNEAVNVLAVSDEEKSHMLSGEKALPGEVPADQEEKQWRIHTVENEKYYVVSSKIDKYSWNIFSLIPVDEFRSNSVFIWIIALAMIIGLSVAVCLIALLLSKYYTKRLGSLSQKIKTLESGDFNARFADRQEESEDELDAIYKNFNFMVEELRHLMKEHYRLGKNVMSAEIKALQAQINPHFLYNTLDLINWGAMDYGAEEIAKLARNLGQFYRLSLNQGRNVISIEEELRHVEAYFNIENAHFDGAISLRVDVSKKIREYACMNIILQPFVENAIMHGIAKHSEIDQCDIIISGEMQETDIHFMVKDNGPGMEPDILAHILQKDNQGIQKGYGVKNINFRLKLCYGELYGVTYESVVGEGTCAHILIPAVTVQELTAMLS